jgi:hypothetical protein
MNKGQDLKAKIIAKKVAAIATKIVGFPYLVRHEAMAWEVSTDDALFERTMKRKYGSYSEIFAEVSKRRAKEMQKEIGMNVELSSAIERIKYKENGIVELESSIMVDLAWSIENDDFNMPFKSIPELDDPKNWPKWKRKMPVTITMLEKCNEAAQKVSKNSGIKILVSRDNYPEGSDEYAFRASFDSSNMNEEQFLKEIERHCRAMVRAYRMYEPWLTGSEYRKLIRARKHIK